LERIKKRFENPEYVIIHSKKIKDALADPEIRKKQSISAKKYWDENPDKKIEISEIKKQFLKDNSHKHPVYICSQKGIFSSLEKKMKSYLDEMNIKYKHNYPQLGYFIDFAILDKKIAIECDGEYWHSLPGAKEYDEVRQKFLESEGWNFIRFSGTEINNDFEFVKGSLIEKINKENLL